jgi:hypothetical protein
MDRMSEMFDAWGIEKAVENLCKHTGSTRGKFYGADVFRGGNEGDLKKFLEKLSQTIKDRVTPALPSDTDRKELNSVADRICATKSRIEKSEREDYHWLIVGDLVRVINLLIEQLEKPVPNP